MNYYNEFDEKTAAWLRELINQKLIPQGYVDTRSITEVTPSDLKGFTQCHFFAGIGGWSLALQLAGWPEDQPVWTGSCPCQPFSVAGKGRGTEDERHLWPVFAELIRACKPTAVFGEQVASKAGREWLAGVFADLEGMAYQRAGADLCAAGVGAPHIRQRLYGVAHSESKGGCWGQSGGAGGYSQSGGSSEIDGMAHSDCERYHGQHALLRDGQGGWNAGDFSEAPRSGKTGWTESRLIQCRDGKSRRIPVEPAFFPLVNGVSSARMGILRGAGNAIVPQVAAEFVGAYLDCLQEDWI